MSVYYKYATDGSNLVVLSYVYYCVYWYTYEELVNWFVDTLGKILHVNFLGCSHQFKFIIISQLKNHSISVYQDRYSTYVIANYLDTATIKENSKSNNTILSHYMIFTKEGASTSIEQVEVFYRE